MPKPTVPTDPIALKPPKGVSLRGLTRYRNATNAAAIEQAKHALETAEYGIAVNTLHQLAKDHPELAPMAFSAANRISRKLWNPLLEAVWSPET